MGNAACNATDKHVRQSATAHRSHDEQPAVCLFDHLEDFVVRPTFANHLFRVHLEKIETLDKRLEQHRLWGDSLLLRNFRGLGQAFRPAGTRCDG